MVESEIGSVVSAAPMASSVSLPRFGLLQMWLVIKSLILE